MTIQNEKKELHYDYQKRKKLLHGLPFCENFGMLPICIGDHQIDCLNLHMVACIVSDVSHRLDGKAEDVIPFSFNFGWFLNLVLSPYL